MSTSIYEALGGARMIKGRSLAGRLGQPEDGVVEIGLEPEEQLRIAIEAIGRLEGRVGQLERDLDEVRGEAARAVRLAKESR